MSPGAVALKAPPGAGAESRERPAAIAVSAELTGGDDDVGRGVVAGSGGVTGTGLAADAQAATSSPTTTVVATRESEKRIPCPPDGMSGETFGGCPCYLRVGTVRRP